jgi:hypothetical protein
MCLYFGFSNFTYCPAWMLCILFVLCEILDNRDYLKQPLYYYRSVYGNRRRRLYLHQYLFRLD